MTKRYDLIVVGAGPAGLTAAKAARECGLEVALLERKTDITNLHRCCGQSLVSMNEYYFGDIFHFNNKGKRMCFPVNRFSLKYDGPSSNIYSWHFYSPDGHIVKLGDAKELKKLGDNGRIAMIHDKEVFFRCLLDEIDKIGVEVFPGINVTDVTRIGENVRVKGGDKSFEATYVIAADGTNSLIAEKMGFNKARDFFCKISSQSFYIRNAKIPELEVALSCPDYVKEIPAFMVIFPWINEDEINAIFLTLDPYLALDEVSDYFMNKHPIYSKWFKDSEKLRKFTSVESICSPIREPFSDNVLIVGDAGGTQEVENTGAMISGWRAGNAVATSVIENKVGIEVKGISHYLRWWKETYIDKYSHEDYVKNFTFSYILSGDDLNYLFGLIKEPLAPCFNPYEALNLISQAIQQAAPTIQQERPDILTRLAKMAAPLEEVLSSIPK